MASMPTTPRFNNSRATDEHGNALGVDHGRYAGGRAQLGKIAGKTIGYIHRRMRMLADRHCQRVARLRHAIASDQHRFCRGVLRERGSDLAAFQDIETERSVADRSRHHNAVAGLGAAARTILPAGTRPNAVIEIISGPGVETVSPPNNGQPKWPASSPSPRAKGVKPAIVRGTQRQRQHEACRRRTLGGEIGEIHPQRLARDGIGRIVGEEMHALDDGVGGDHDDRRRKI